MVLKEILVLENIVNNIGLTNINTTPVKRTEAPAKRSIKTSDIYLPKLKRDIYERSPRRTSSASVYKASNINQYNPKLLLKAYANVGFIQDQINSNPELKAIVDKYNLNEINTKNVLNIVDSHLTTTAAYALKIANQLGLSTDEKKQLQQACIFHDFGKVLIPEEILNKPGALTDEEKEIMDLHSELGYQLLLNTGINERVLDMVRNHHKKAAENDDLLGQILSVADIYSALRERRAYKQPLSVNTALDILDQKAINGEVSAEVVDSLSESNMFRS